MPVGKINGPTLPSFQTGSDFREIAACLGACGKSRAISRGLSQPQELIEAHCDSKIQEPTKYGFKVSGAHSRATDLEDLTN